MPFLTSVLRWLERIFSFKTLRQKFIVGFAIASLLAVGNILVIQSLLRQSDAIAATINIAGKMRMLSQRIGLLQLAAQDLKIETPQTSVAALQQLETDFESAMRVLRDGGRAFDLTTPAVAGEPRRHLEKIRSSWEYYRRALDMRHVGVIYFDGKDKETAYGAGVILETVSSSELLLHDIEALINHLVVQSQNMQERVMYKVYGLFFVNVLMLLLAWTIISSKVLKPIKRVMHLSNELTAGNYGSRLSMNSDDEFGSLSRVLNRSAAHIEHLLHDLELKQSTLKLAEVKLRRASLVYGHISDGVVVTDPDGYVQDVNPAFSLITGYDAEEVIGNRMSKLSAGRHSADFFRSFWKRLQETGHWSGDIWNKHKSGEEFVSHLMINTCFNDDGSVNCRIGLFSNVTEKRRQEALIWRQAHFDHLTQLPNRHMFHENLQRSMEQSRRSGLPFALIFLDLDLFKEVNDTFGHDEGDVLLQQVAKRISQCCRRSDQVARMGGDEFVVIAQDLQSPDNVHAICNEILRSISKPYNLTVNDIRISCSIGVAFYPDDAHEPTELLKYVDLAMYAAKEKGRNQYCLFSNTMRDSVQLRHDLLRDMQTALDTQQFFLYYQPIVHLESGRIAKAEALVRWMHPVRGLISPADFIPLAEDSSLIVPLGESVFFQAAQQVASWRNSFNEAFEVSINVSPAQFQLGGLNPQRWAHQLQELRVSGSAITIEITERLLMESDEETYEKIREFRRAGIQIALDDFGTGYSSLSYLRRVDIDIIKIDQSFVNNLTESSENMALCNAIITMAHQLGMKVVAEGIESEQQHELLLAAGCDYGQGYFYSRPINAEQFTDWLTSLYAGDVRQL